MKGNGLPLRIDHKQRRASAMSMIADMATFVSAVSGSFLIPLGAQLPVCDLVLAPALPVLCLTRGRRLARPTVKILFVLLGLWLLAEFVADIYHHSEFGDWMRIDARIVSIGMDFAALAMLIGRHVRRQVLFLVGLAIGQIGQARFQPSELSVNEPWKFGYGVGVTLAVVLVATYFAYRRKYWIVALLLFGITAVHLRLNYRQPILTLFLTAVLILPIIPERIGRIKILPNRGSVWRVLVLAAMAVLAGEAASLTVSLLSSHGVLGESARLKDEAEAHAKGGILLGGRPEILISSRAVAESPILGHGAWAKDMRLAEMYLDMQVTYGLSDEEPEEDEAIGVIPTHSHLMDAWVDAGILGAVFWMYVFYLYARATLRISDARGPLALALVFSFVNGLWAILFSPPGGVTILPECFLMLVAANVIEAGVVSAAPRLRRRGVVAQNSSLRHARPMPMRGRL